MTMSLKQAIKETLAPLKPKRIHIRREDVMSLLKGFIFFAGPVFSLTLLVRIFFDNAIGLAIVLVFFFVWMCFSIPVLAKWQGVEDNA